MESISEYLWIAFFLGAYVVMNSRRGNVAIVAGLVGLGIPTFLGTLYRNDLIPSELKHAAGSVFQVAFPVAAVLVIYGVIKLVANQRQTPLRGDGSLASGAVATNLASLFTPRNATNTYSKAEKLRDDVYERLVRSAKAHGLDAVEQRSNAFSPTVWLRLDYRIPQSRPELSLRASLQVTVERFDYHRFEHLFTVEVQVGVEIKRFTSVIAIDDEFADRIHRFVANSGSGLPGPRRVREKPFQLWRPANKVNRLRPDWVAIGGTALAVCLVFIPFVGVFFTMGILIGLYLRKKRRRTYVLTTGKPHTDPRSLRWMDSWQASVVGLGPAAVQVSDGIMSRITTNAPTDLVVSVEHIGYWGVDSRVERDQVAIRYRRALAFAQIVPHGATLYVSWECHLNSASWAEQTLARGVDRESGLDVHANRVVLGSLALNEYDLADSNFLSEWVHEACKQVLKLKMAEHQIDQEIDFTVQRESRKEALGGGQADAQQKHEQRKRFKRVA
jgi:hypothetical protein